MKTEEVIPLVTLRGRRFDLVSAAVRSCEAASAGDETDNAHTFLIGELLYAGLEGINFRIDNYEIEYRLVRRPDPDGSVKGVKRTATLIVS